MPHPIIRPVLLLSLLSLAACKSGSDGAGPGPDPDPGGSGILGSYYVSSFDAFEVIAANLRDNVQRYLIQAGDVTVPDNPTTPGNEGGTYFSYPLASARVEYAHAVGLTGAGQIISVVDAGFRTTHEVFAGKNLDSTGAIPLADHGTMVASIAAGSSNTMIGVAPGADLHFGYFGSDASLTAATQRALAIGAVAQNNSWGFPSLPVGQASFNFLFGDAGGAAYLAALDAYAAQGVVVFAVDNDATNTNATIMEGLPAVRPSLEAGWLAVGNAVPVYNNDRIISAVMVSSRCLEAAAWCLVADGYWAAATATSNSSYGSGLGSSFAAPQVSGALALLAEAFPDLSPHDLRIRLLASADNGFFTPDGTIDLLPGPEQFLHGYSTSFGHGFLDLRAALLPIGPTTLAMANGTRYDAERPLLVSGTAMGDAVTRSLEGIDVAVSDVFAARFRMPGKALAAPITPQPLAAGLAARRIGDDLTSMRTAPAALSRPSFEAYTGRTLDLSDAESGVDVSLLLPAPGTGAEEYGISVHKALTDGPTRLELGLKLARDGGSVIGFGASQAGSGGAGLVAVELGLHSDFGGGGFLSITGETGLADLGASSVLSGTSRARFNSFGFDIGQRGVFAKGDRLALGLSSPVAITGGRTELQLPVMRSDGGTEIRSVAIDLAPQARQVDLSLSYQVPLGKGQELLLELQHAENFGNQRGLRDTAAVLGMKFTF